MYYVGLDIGGTKCAIILGKLTGTIEIIDRKEFFTASYSVKEVLEKYCGYIDSYKTNYQIKGIGISCGGPLDSKNGVILCPPNLIGWKNIKIVKFFKDKYSFPTYLQNDANACAVAEWKYGAGMGKKNVIFLTFGTGLGAGLILDGKLYSGTNDNAGEIGHIRMRKTGAIGFGKAGSLEGFCSGGGIARTYQILLEKELLKNPNSEKLKQVNNKNLSAKLIAEKARQGDNLCIKTYNLCGKVLGEGLSILIDILNPEVIILGGVYMRSGDLIIPSMKKVIKRESLSLSNEICQIKEAKLGERIGDYASLSIAKGEF